MSYKVYVYAICKNEEAFVDRWMDSMGEADEIIVTDTGSTDGTVEKLRSRGAVVHVEAIQPWRFDAARNLSLAHVPKDADICVCTDLDEVFRPGWRKHLEARWIPGATMGNYLYNWSLNPDGTPGVQFRYFKIHTREEYTWAYPVHECLQYIGKKPEKKVFLEGVVLDHFPDSTKSRGSYLPLLEMGVREMPGSDRMAYYLGREYMYAARWRDCIDTLTRHLSLPSCVWREERCASMRWIAKAHHELGDREGAYRWYYRAVAEVPTMRDAYVEFAKTAYLYSDWPTAYFMAEEALKIKERSPVYSNAAYSWDHTPNDLAAIACFQLGMYGKAALHARTALTFSPGDARLQKNLEMILGAVEPQRQDLGALPQTPQDLGALPQTPQTF